MAGGAMQMSGFVNSVADEGATKEENIAKAIKMAFEEHTIEGKGPVKSSVDWQERAEKAARGPEKGEMRVLHMELLTATGIDLAKFEGIITKCNEDTKVKVSLSVLGSKAEPLAGDIWKEVNPFTEGATHALVVVADDLAALKTFMNGAYGDFKKEAGSLISNSFVVDTPLGLDILFADKADPALIIYFLRLKPEVTKESTEYAGMDADAVKINALPGAKGRMAASFQPTGFVSQSQAQVLEGLGSTEDKSAGFTHAFVMFVESAKTSSKLFKNKTFLSWKAQVDACADAGAGPSKIAFVVPVEFYMGVESRVNA